MSLSQVLTRNGFIRYFLILCLIFVSAYLYTGRDEIFILLLGPPMEASSFLARLVYDKLGLRIPNGEYTVLLPVSLLYYGLIGFQVKKLLNERGILRAASLLAFIGFLLFLHYRSWKVLSSLITPSLP